MLKFEANDMERELMRKIGVRAAELAKDLDFHYPPFDCMMDLEACHCSGNPLDLNALLEADDGNFAHDVFGIRRHLSRESGELMNYFAPRFAKREGGEN